MLLKNIALIDTWGKKKEKEKEKEKHNMAHTFGIEWRIQKKAYKSLARLDLEAYITYIHRQWNQRVAVN